MALIASILSVLRFASEVIDESLALRAAVNRRYPGLAHSE